MMIRKQWERDGVDMVKKPKVKVPAILNLLKTRPYLRVGKPLTPGQMAVLEGIKIRNLPEQQVWFLGSF